MRDQLIVMVLDYCRKPSGCCYTKKEIDIYTDEHLLGMINDRCAKLEKAVYGTQDLLFRESDIGINEGAGAPIIYYGDDGHDRILPQYD